MQLKLLALGNDFQDLLQHGFADSRSAVAKCLDREQGTDNGRARLGAAAVFRVGRFKVIRQRAGIRLRKHQPFIRRTFSNFNVFLCHVLHRYKRVFTRLPFPQFCFGDDFVKQLCGDPAAQ